MKDMHIKLDFDVTVHVDGKAVSVRELLAIDETNLSNEYATQSARYVYFATLEAQAHALWQQAKEAREREEAVAFIEFKNDETSIPKGSRSVSDVLAKELVAADDQCLDYRAAEMKAEHDYLVLRAVTRAFYMRSSMLQSFGANMRHEQDMDGISIREKDTVERSMRRAVIENRTLVDPKFSG
jgi:hypothetical protein